MINAIYNASLKNSKMHILKNDESDILLCTEKPPAHPLVWQITKINIEETSIWICKRCKRIIKSHD